MNNAADEANRITQKVLAGLSATISGAPTDASAQFNATVGALAANAPSLLDVPWDQFWSTPNYLTELTACFEQARLAGASYEAMQTVWALGLTIAPAYNFGAAVLNLTMRLVLAEEAQILAKMTFVSRSQIDSYIDAITTNFAAAIEIAADNMDGLVYRSLIALQSCVINDLSTRAAPLPQIVTTSFPKRLPALTIAWRLYQDPTEVAAIVAMNSVSHPLFCPMSLHVLSNGAP